MTQITTLLFILFLLLLVPDVSEAARDYPHNKAETIECLSCHYVAGATQPSWATHVPVDIDDSKLNNLCWSCHTQTPGDPPFAKTHSSLTTDNSHGDWSIECRTCHDPHRQKQTSAYGSASYIETGTSTGKTTTTLTDSAKNWTTDEFAGMILIPNTALVYPNSFMYQISGNTSDAITIDGTMDASLLAANSAYAVVKGKLIKNSINAPDRANCSVEGNQYVCTSTTAKTTRFFNSAGANSFADGDATYDGVCEVCHTQTTHFRNDGSGSDQTHATIGGASGANCTVNCHKHLNGFKPQCDICHAFPPVDVNGLVENVSGPPGTGSASAGAHNMHVNTLGFGCQTCHVNSLGEGPTHTGSRVITIGFPILFGGSVSGGSYDGQTTANYDSSEANTTVTNNGSMQCSNIYCHGNFSGSGLNAAPSWNNPSSAACGTCHGASNPAPPASGSHLRHSYTAGSINNGHEIACTVCHKDIVGGSGPAGYIISDRSKHMSGYIDWKFDTNDLRVSASSSYSIPSGSAVPSNGTAPRAYGTCSNTYCHSNAQPEGGVGQPDSYTSPQWGATGICGTCHKGDGDWLHTGPSSQMNSGSHSKHLEYNFTGGPFVIYRCSVCHKFNPTGTANTCGMCHATDMYTKHVNHEVNIMFDSNVAGSAAYNGTLTPGDGYSTCSNTYCHGSYIGSGLNASPEWGNASTGACGTCHKAKNNDVLTSGTHEKHAGNGFYSGIGSMQTNKREFSCTLCHNGIVGGSGPDAYTISDKLKHVSNEVDWQFDTTDPRLGIGTPSYSIATGTQSPSDGASRAYGTCSLYCHSDVQPNGGVGPPATYNTPQWGTAEGCYGCHAGTTGTAGNYDNAVSRHTSRFKDFSTATGSHYKHVSGQDEGRCRDCHNWFYPNNATGSGCGNCHLATYWTLESIYHINGEVNIMFNARAVSPYGTLSGTSVADSSATYSGTPAPGDGYGYCSNIYCHSDGTSIRTRTTGYVNTTPAWGSTGTPAGETIPCNTCHGNATYSDWRKGMPLYVNGSPKENSHEEHAVENGISCQSCHTNITLDGAAINSRGAHADANYSLGANTGVQYANRNTIFAGYPSKLPPNPAGPGYCRSSTCHGAKSASTLEPYYMEKIYTYWGEKLSCGDCHLSKARTSGSGTLGVEGGGDVDSYTYGDGAHAWIDADQWRYSGHGKQAGTYDASGNPAANFTQPTSGACADWTAPGGITLPSQELAGCDPCLYCHDDSVIHDVTNSGTNPFRLKDHAGANGWNDVCLVCHETGSSGFDPDGAGAMSLKNGSVKVDSAHYGAKHGAPNDGGSLCYDCHDPHGDRISGNGNIYMIHKDVTKDKDDATGEPLTTVSPVFTSATTGTDYAASSAPYNGICNVCHTITNHYTSSSGDGHNSGQKCTDCHTYNGGFP
ncbi:MAG: CxxxxCH/CxxCH domain-containing protein [Nitrospirota bacterium]